MSIEDWQEGKATAAYKRMQECEQAGSNIKAETALDVAAHASDIKVNTASIVSRLINLRGTITGKHNKPVAEGSTAEPKPAGFLPNVIADQAYTKSHLADIERELNILEDLFGGRKG